MFTLHTCIVQPSRRTKLVALTFMKLSHSVAEAHVLIASYVEHFRSTETKWRWQPLVIALNPRTSQVQLIDMIRCFLRVFGYRMNLLRAQEHAHVVNVDFVLNRNLSLSQQSLHSLRSRSDETQSCRTSSKKQTWCETQVIRRTTSLFSLLCNETFFNGRASRTEVSDVAARFESNAVSWPSRPDTTVVI